MISKFLVVGDVEDEEKDEDENEVMMRMRLALSRIELQWAGLQLLRRESTFWLNTHQALSLQLSFFHPHVEQFLCPNWTLLSSRSKEPWAFFMSYRATEKYM